MQKREQLKLALKSEDFEQCENETFYCPNKVSILSIFEQQCNFLSSFQRKLEIFSGAMQFELPGVSTTVSVKLTPFSLRRTFWVSIATVFLSRCEGPGYSLEYMSVKNIELINVDLPSPDSPTTIKVNSKPFLTAFRYTWLGKLANPTQPSSCFTFLTAALTSGGAGATAGVVEILKYFKTLEFSTL